MSTEQRDRQLGDRITRTEPSNENDGAIGTPAAAFDVKTIPDEVDLSVATIAEDMVAVTLSSATLSGKVMVEPEPARELAADLLEAAAAAESREVDQ